MAALQVRACRIGRGCVVVGATTGDPRKLWETRHVAVPEWRAARLNAGTPSNAKGLLAMTTQTPAPSLIAIRRQRPRDEPREACVPAVITGRPDG